MSDPQGETPEQKIQLRLDGVSKTYSRGSETVQVLEQLDLEVPEGDFLALMGPSGSGKTTLLNLIGGLDRPHHRQRRGGGGAGGQRLGSSAVALARARHIGFVFQFYNLLPVLTAERNVELPLLLTRLDRKSRKRHVATALEVVGLANRARHYPRQLSGGQEQRVGIARAIVSDPDILLCDEPTGDLDRKSGDEILDLLVALNRDHGKTIIMVTHDPLAAQRARRTLHLDKGKLVTGDGGMSFFHLILANLGRKKFRTVFTALSIFVAFMLYGLLMAVKAAFGVGVELVGIDRLVMIHKVSLIQPLPIAYKSRIETVEGVNAVTHANWFGGIYQDPKNFFPQFAVDPEGYLDMYPEILLPEEQKEAWARNRIGAVVGRITADRFGWKVGDRVPLRGTIFRNRDGGLTWEFVIEGIFDGADETTDLTPMLFHFDYLVEGANIPEVVGWYILRVEDPQRAAEVAEAVDERFANSPAETRTATESAFIQGFANQTGNISAIVMGIAGVVFFTLLLITGNTMAQSVRERTNELAVLKTLGFTGSQVMGMVLVESMLLAIVGGGAGLALVAWITRVTRLGGDLLPTLHLPWPAVGTGAVLVLAMGLLAGLLPALQALRLGIVDALGRRA